MNQNPLQNFPNNTWHDRLANRWGLESKWQFWLIFIAFALSGSTSASISTYLLVLINQSGVVSSWQLVVIKILLLIAIYPPVLMTIGSAFGQYKFFSTFLVKRFLRK